MTTEATYDVGRSVPEGHRKTPVYLWTDGTIHLFSPFPEVTGRFTVLAPVGWTLAQDDCDGPVLVNLFEVCLRAHEVYRKAVHSEDGFRLGGRATFGRAKVAARRGVDWPEPD